MLRRRRPVEEVRPEVPARWRAVIADCERLLVQLTDLVRSAPPGPLKSRLEVLEAGVRASVDEAIEAAHRAGEVERLATTIDVAGVTAAYKAARRDAEAAARRGPVPEHLAASLESLARQHGSAHRLLNAVDETDVRLAGVRTRLTEIVLTAGELSLGGGHGEVADQQASALAADVRALREAFGELG